MPKNNKNINLMDEAKFSIIELKNARSKFVDGKIGAIEAKAHIGLANAMSTAIRVAHTIESQAK